MAYFLEQTNFEISKEVLLVKIMANLCKLSLIFLNKLIFQKKIKKFYWQKVCQI